MCKNDDDDETIKLRVLSRVTLKLLGLYNEILKDIIMYNLLIINTHVINTTLLMSTNIKRYFAQILSIL